jgi:hypothetical protein
MQRMARLEKLALWLVAAAVMVPIVCKAQAPAPAGAGTAAGGAPGPVNVWTFSTDSSNNLVIQDFSSFATAQGSVVGQPICLQFAAPCPTENANRVRRRYSLRGTGGKAAEWRLELADMVFPQGGMSLPFTAGTTGDKGTVQAVSSPGPWTIDLQRIPATELHAGDGKRWKVGLNLEKVEAGSGCWVEVQCPAKGQ